MGGKLDVVFGDPDDGWIVMTIRSGPKAATLTASYVLFDTVKDLVDSLLALTTADGATTVRFYEEPAVCELCFKGKDGIVKLQVWCDWSDRALLDIEGSIAEVCLPFWRALRDLQTRFSEKEFKRRWRFPFPASGMERLTASLTRGCDQ